jgi:hypothetical protein
VVAFHTWAPGEVLTAANMLAFLPSAPSLYQIIAGQTSYSFSAASAAAATITYGYTYTTVIAVLPCVQGASSNDILVTLSGAPGVSTAGVRLAQKDGTSITTSGQVHWVVIGTT